MADLSEVLSTLTQERRNLDLAIAALEGITSNGTSSTSGSRQISADGRRRIAAAQRAHWAKVRGERNSGYRGTKVARKHVISIAARKRIAAAQRARWAKYRREKRAA